MTKTRRMFTDDFKREAVALLESSGWPLMQVAAELGIQLPRLAAGIQQEWAARKDHDTWCARQIRQALISRVNAAMKAGFPVLQVLVPMAPLLGLIGTVTGMLGTFGALASGAGGEKTMAAIAKGISEALS